MSVLIHMGRRILGRIYKCTYFSLILMFDVPNLAHLFTFKCRKITTSLLHKSLLFTQHSVMCHKCRQCFRGWRFCKSWTLYLSLLSEVSATSSPSSPSVCADWGKTNKSLISNHNYTCRHKAQYSHLWTSTTLLMLHLSFCDFLFCSIGLTTKLMTRYLGFIHNTPYLCW